MLRTTTTAALLGAAAFFAQPVLADEHADMTKDITCEQFLVMTEEEQGKAMDELIAGRDEAREEMRGDDPAMEWPEETRDETWTRVVETCNSNGELGVGEVMMHPSDK